MSRFTESEIEEAALEWLEALGWQAAHGPDIGPDADSSERADYGAVVLERRLRDALNRLNPGLPADALDDAFRKLTWPEGATLETRNRAFHRLLVDGVTVEYRVGGGALQGAQVAVVDYEDPIQNDWLAVNQFTVVEGEHERRPDIVLFVNGLPLGLIELKNPADEKATVLTAWRQIQTYKAELSDLFAFNAALIASDGVDARVGTLTAGREWFKPWRTIDGETLAGSHLPQLQVMLEGMCERRRFLILVRDFIVFEDDGGGTPAKKMAGYHQFHAVGTAVVETLRATRSQREGSELHETSGGYESGRQPGGESGDRRIGVVWHTQGSGKSLTMAFYAGRIIREPAGEAGAGRGGTAEDRSRLRGSDGRRGSRPQGEAQDEVGAARGGRWRRTAAQAHRGGHRLALRPALRGPGRQGDDRLHEPPHLHRPLQGAGSPAPGLAARR